MATCAIHLTKLFALIYQNQIQNPTSIFPLVVGLCHGGILLVGNDGYHDDDVDPDKIPMTIVQNTNWYFVFWYLF